MNIMSVPAYKMILEASDDKLLLELRQLNESMITQYEDLMSKAQNQEERLLFSQLGGVWHNNAKIHMPLIEAEIAKRGLK